MTDEAPEGPDPFLKMDFTQFFRAFVDGCRN